MEAPHSFSPVLTPVGVAAFIFLLARLTFLRLSRRREVLQRFPPGPSTIPILGNVHQLPQEYQELTFAEWAKSYGGFRTSRPRWQRASLLSRRRRSNSLLRGAGDVVFAKIFRRPVLVLNSLRAAQELLEKRSGNYSDRPRLILLAELYGISLAYSSTHRSDR